MPAVGFEALGTVFRKSQLRGTFNRNVVIIVEVDQLAQAQGAS